MSHSASQRGAAAPQKGLSPASENGPKISIVVCTLNAANYLQRCIDSVASQNYDNKELLIADGASTDGTLDIIARNESRIQWWLSEPDSGYYEAANKALDQITGDWVYFLGSDDYFASADCLSTVAAKMKTLKPTTMMAYGIVAFATQDGDIQFMRGQPWPTRLGFLQETSVMHTQGVFHRKEIFEIFGRYDERFRIAGDYDLILRVLKRYEPVFFSDVTIAIHTLGGLSTNPDSQLKAISEIRSARVANGLPANRLRMVWYYRKNYYHVWAGRSVVIRRVHDIKYHIKYQLLRVARAIALIRRGRFDVIFQKIRRRLAMEQTARAGEDNQDENKKQ